MPAGEELRKHSILGPDSFLHWQGLVRRQPQQAAALLGVVSGCPPQLGGHSVFHNRAQLAASHGHHGGWHHHLALTKPNTPGLSIEMGVEGLCWVSGRIQTAPMPPPSARTTPLCLDVTLTTRVQREDGTEHLHVHRKPTKQPWDP